MQFSIIFVALVAAATGTHALRHGDGTHYTPGVGACGHSNKPSDLVVAVSEAVYDSFPNPNPGNPNTSKICGKQVTAHHKGKTVQVHVVDKCPGCTGNDLDFSPAAFKKLAPLGAGRIPVSWKFD